MPIFRNYNVKNKHLPVKKIHKDRRERKQLHYYKGTNQNTVCYDGYFIK